MQTVAELSGFTLGRDPGGDLQLLGPRTALRFPPGPVDLVHIEGDPARCVLVGALRADDETGRIDVRLDDEQLVTRTGEGGWLSEPLPRPVGRRIVVRWLDRAGDELRSFELPPVDATSFNRAPTTYATDSSESTHDAPTVAPADHLISILDVDVEGELVTVGRDPDTGRQWLTAGKRPPLALEAAKPQLCPAGPVAGTIVIAGLFDAAGGESPPRIDLPDGTVVNALAADGAWLLRFDRDTFTRLPGLASLTRRGGR